MKTLLSMVDFIEEIKDYVHESHNNERGLELIFNYAEFLKQSLTLGMLVPCDENGNVLTEPFYDPANEQYWAGERFMYDSAKEKVLFKDCEVKNIKATHKHDIDYFVVYYKSQQLWISWTERIIEDMIKHSLEISESAIKQIGI